MHDINNEKLLSVKVETAMPTEAQVPLSLLPGCISVTNRNSEVCITIV
jgi:hypothetical protein